MQQVFGLVNELLFRDASARQRGLCMRTYRVVPIAPTAGVLQWVENTTPLSAYLISNQRGGLAAAHERYRPADMKSGECREVMAKAVDAVVKKRQPPQHKLDQFRVVCDRFRPVLHHFFLERWQQPAAWFDRRLSFAASLAAGSMVGFVLGLGDRHMSNILIDVRTAELVHIDLGIAFEAGKLLQTPETVPFRLTRDLEDALGVCGVEGVMRGGCEQTMRVLRANTEALVTILQVFVRNPLYKWVPQAPSRAASNAVGRADGPAGEQHNQDAERTLLRIQQKLEGALQGGSGRDGAQQGSNGLLSVEGQVRRHIGAPNPPSNPLPNPPARTPPPHPHRYGSC